MGKKEGGEGGRDEGRRKERQTEIDQTQDGKSLLKFKACSQRHTSSNKATPCNPS